MNDLGKFKHGEECTHSFCAQSIKEYGGQVLCCQCSGHKCKNELYDQRRDLRSKYYDRMVEIIDINFPKGESGERGAALVVLAHIELMLRKDEQSIPPTGTYTTEQGVLYKYLSPILDEYKKHPSIGQLQWFMEQIEKLVT